MKNYLNLIVAIFSILGPNLLFAQFDSFRDPGVAYNKIILDQSNGTTFDIISNYKVIGTPYLFGENNGSIFTKNNESALNIVLKYNAYTQKLEIKTNENTQFITKNYEEIDSFYITATDQTLFKNDLHFVRGSLIDNTKRNFMQIIYAGKNATLYKAYYSDLGIVSTNYVQSELRQYEIKFDYYYSSPNTKGLKKIKLNGGWIQKEFSLFNIQSNTVERLSNNSESTLKQVFKIINQ